MNLHQTCIAIDDDLLFLRKIEAYLEDLPWLSLMESFDNPVKGATAVISQRPDLVLLDLEMPYVDGESLLDWLEPHMKRMGKKPKIVIITGLEINPKDIKTNVLGYIDKDVLKSPKDLDRELKRLLMN